LDFVEILSRRNLLVYFQWHIMSHHDSLIHMYKRSMQKSSFSRERKMISKRVSRITTALSIIQRIYL
jgi:hypothetical protein